MAEVPRKPVTLNLRTYVAEHLDELARLAGSTPDQVVESAIEERYAKRAHLAVDECPWEITDQAKTDYLWIVGARATQESLAAAAPSRTGSRCTWSPDPKGRGRGS